MPIQQQDKQSRVFCRKFTCKKSVETPSLPLSVHVRMTRKRKRKEMTLQRIRTPDRKNLQVDRKRKSTSHIPVPHVCISRIQILGKRRETERDKGPFDKIGKIDRDREMRKGELENRKKGGIYQESEQSRAPPFLYVYIMRKRKKEHNFGQIVL